MLARAAQARNKGAGGRSRQEGYFRPAPAVCLLVWSAPAERSGDGTFGFWQLSNEPSDVALATALQI